MIGSERFVDPSPFPAAMAPFDCLCPVSGILEVCSGGEKDRGDVVLSVAFLKPNPAFMLFRHFSSDLLRVFLVYLGSGIWAPWCVWGSGVFGV